MIERADIDGIAVVRLAHGKVNALDVELVEAIVETFTELASSAVRAVVLTGAGPAFCAGVDLRRFTGGGAEYASRFLAVLDDAFEAVFTTPQPVIAAVNGHAIAGGCVLACACDRRLMVDGTARIGVPELVVGVPFPSAAFEVMRFAVGPAALPALFSDAGTYSAVDALGRGLIDEVVDAEAMLDRALTIARELSGERVPARTFRFAKAQLRRDAVAAIARNRPRDQPDVTALWTDPATHAWIDAYMARVTGKRD